MSALTPKADCSAVARVRFGSEADMCGALVNVCFGPRGDIHRVERHGETLCKSLIRQPRFSQALRVPIKILRPAKRNLILQIRNMGRRIELS